MICNTLQAGGTVSVSENWGQRGGRGVGGGQKTSAMFAEYWLGRVPGGAASLLLTQACGVYDFQRLLQVTQRAHILRHDRQAERLAQSSP